MLVAAWEAAVNCVVELTGEPDLLRTAIGEAALGMRRMSSVEIDEARVHVEATGMSHWNAVDTTARSILARLVDGMSDTQIAEELGLGVQTIRNRVSRLLDEFVMTNRTQLAVAVTKAQLGVWPEQELFREVGGEDGRK
jgi:DNA-binding NarL/FixJ family response regulator